MISKSGAGPFHRKAILRALADYQQPHAGPVSVHDLHPVQGD